MSERTKEHQRVRIPLEDAFDYLDKATETRPALSTPRDLVVEAMEWVDLEFGGQPHGKED